MDGPEFYAYSTNYLIDVLVVQHDVLVIFVLVALDDVRQLDFLVRLLAGARVADGRQVTLVEHRELERLAILRQIEFDRDIDEPEADGALPDCAGQGQVPPSFTGASPRRHSTQTYSVECEDVTTPHSQQTESGAPARRAQPLAPPAGRKQGSRSSGPRSMLSTAAAACRRGGRSPSPSRDYAKHEHGLPDALSTAARNTGHRHRNAASRQAECRRV